MALTPCARCGSSESAGLVLRTPRCVRNDTRRAFGSVRVEAKAPGVGIRGLTLAVVGEEPVGEEPSFRIMEATLA